MKKEGISIGGREKLNSSISMFQISRKLSHDIPSQIVSIATYFVITATFGGDLATIRPERATSAPLYIAVNIATKANPSANPTMNVAIFLHW